MTDRMTVVLPVWLTVLSVMLPVASAAAPVEGAVVRKVVLQRDPIFSPEDRASAPWLPLGWADAVHVDTRAQVIRRELAFQEGERLDADALEESARRLRRRGLFAEVELEARPAPGDSVDILVRTRELWTTTLEFSYERFDGQVLWAAEVAERSLLGTGYGLSLARSEDIDRDSWAAGFDAPQLLGSRRWEARGSAARSDDGSATQWALARPFFRVGSAWATEARFANVGSRPRATVPGADGAYVRPHVDVTVLELGARWRLATRPGHVLRWGLALEHESQRVQDGRVLGVVDPDGEGGGDIFFGEREREDRDLWTPGLLVARETRRYGQYRFLERMGRVEDIPLGPTFELAAGWALADRAALGGPAWRARARWFTPRGEWLLHGNVEASGLDAESGPVNVRQSARATAWWLPHDQWRLVLSMLAGSGSGLDRHRSFSLGVESGLRASRVAALRGDRLLRANAAVRWHHREPLWGLFTPGAAAFVDLGDAWVAEEEDLEIGRLRGSVGFGLRVGLDKASQSLPLRFDIAWPFLEQSGTDGPVLSVGSGHAF